MCVCVGPPDVIAKGSATVMIGNMPAARMGDLTAHGGTIVLGFPTVMIGDSGSGGAGGGGGSAGGINSLCPAIGSLDSMPLRDRLAAEESIVNSIQRLDPNKTVDLNRQRHDRDMGVLSAAAYSTKDGSVAVLPPGYSKAPQEDLGKLGVTNELLTPDMRVFRKDGEDGQPHYVLAYRGTETGAGLKTAANDIGTDVLQAVGFKTDAYERGTEAAQLMATSGDPPPSVELTGHSKGGGQAAAASAASGLPATTFNAAGVHERTFERAGVTDNERKDAQKNIRAYNNERDPLNGAQDGRTKVLGVIGATATFFAGIFGAGLVAMLAVDGALPPALGQRITVPAARNQGTGLGEGHSMDTLVQAMNEQIETKLKETCGC
jgi:hypothetical protein